MSETNEQQSSGKIRKKCRISRNKKQYWKRGADVQDVETLMHEVRVDTSEGGPLWKREDDNLFSIDREPDNGNDKLTRRQQAALLKRMKKTEPADEEDDTPKKQFKKTFPKKLNKQEDEEGTKSIRFTEEETTKTIEIPKISEAPAIFKMPKITVDPKTPKKIEDPKIFGTPIIDETLEIFQTPNIETRKISDSQKQRDLWDVYGNGRSSRKVSTPFGNLFRDLNNGVPKKRYDTVNHLGMLAAVEVDPSGASYNPPVSEYWKYVAKVGKEEEEKIKEEEKIERQLALAKGEKYITEEEKEAEMREGLDDSGEIAESEDEEEVKEEEEKRTMKPKAKPRTTKARRSERLERKRKELKDASKFLNEQMHWVYATRKINKEIDEKLWKQEESTRKRNEKRLLKRCALTRRLGRGKFEPCEKPVLLPDELPGSLRELKPQGCILTERMKSWQKRNILSIPGEKRTQEKLKSRLRFKNREDRKHQEVKIGTRLI